jgi:hypothetical protein
MKRPSNIDSVEVQKHTLLINNLCDNIFRMGAPSKQCLLAFVTNYFLKIHHQMGPQVPQNDPLTSMLANMIACTAII